MKICDSLGTVLGMNVCKDEGRAPVGHLRIRHIDVSPSGLHSRVQNVQIPGTILLRNLGVADHLHSLRAVRSLEEVGTGRSRLAAGPFGPFRSFST